LNTASRGDDALRTATELLDVLPLVTAAIRGGMRRNIRDGLSVPQFRCLAFINRQPGTSVSDVTAFLGVTMATTSAMVDRLAAAGYVTVAVSPTDRRRSHLTASESGQALLARMRGGAQAELAEALSDLSVGQLSTLRKAAALLQRSFHRG
jgi:DNA-binding MarR family transcriptional regulator